MELRFLSALVWTLLVVTVSSEESQAPSKFSEDRKDSLLVSKKLMRLMMGCSLGTSGEPREAKVPVHVTNIDPETDTESQHLTLMRVSDFQEYVESSVYNDELIRHMLGRIQEALGGPMVGERPSFRHSPCSVENNITISVPPQEMKDFNEHLEQMLQQNSRLLLDQMNPLITYKLNKFYSDMENLVAQRFAVLADKFNQIQTKLQQVIGKTQGIKNADVDDDDDDDDGDDVQPSHICSLKGLSLCKNFEERQKTPSNPALRSALPVGSDNDSEEVARPAIPQSRQKVRNPVPQRVAGFEQFWSKIPYQRAI